MTTRHVSKTLLLFLSPILVLSAVAQPAPGSAVPTVSFDVVSIRQNNSGNRQMTRQSSGTSDGITMTNVPPFLIVFYAYGINDENLATGFPLWAMNERYDLTAKVAASDEPAYQSLTNRQRGQMLQKVLADRFHLQVHRESRNRPVYALVVAKSGIKIKEVSADKPSASTSKPSDSGFAQWRDDLLKRTGGNHGTRRHHGRSRSFTLQQRGTFTRASGCRPHRPARQVRLYPRAPRS